MGGLDRSWGRGRSEELGVTSVVGSWPRTDSSVLRRHRRGPRPAEPRGRLGGRGRLPVSAARVSATAGARIVSLDRDRLGWPATSPRRARATSSRRRRRRPGPRRGSACRDSDRSGFLARQRSTTASRSAGTLAVNCDGGTTGSRACAIMTSMAVSPRNGRSAGEQEVGDRPQAHRCRSAVGRLVVHDLLGGHVQGRAGDGPLLRELDRVVSAARSSPGRNRGAWSRRDGRRDRPRSGWPA